VSRRRYLLGGLLLLVAAAAGPALAVMVDFQRELRRDRAVQARAVAVQQAQLLSASVDEIVEGARQMLVALSASRRVRDMDPACADVLHELRRADPSYSVLAVVRRDGTPVCSDATVPLPVDALAGLASPFLSVTGFVTGRYTSLPSLAPPMVTFALPLHLGESGPGILIAGMDLSRLGVLLAGLDRPHLGRFVVADREGTVLADAPDQPGLVGRPATPVQRAAVDAKSAGATLFRDETGDWRIMGFVPPGLDPAALFVCTGFSIGDLIGGIDAAARRGYLLIVMGAALSVLLALFIAHRYLRVPASVLLAAARRWGSGDLAARAEMPNAVAAEFAGLGHAFNEMAELLQQQRSELQALNEALEVRVADRTRALLDSNNRLQVEIAERELTEGSLRQVQKLQAVGQLADGMAHEFNNVLSAILGSMDLLRTRLGTPDSRQETLLDRATLSVERGSRLTAQLLAFSRKQPLLAVSVSVAEVIHAMIGLLESTLGTTVRLETRVNDDLWPAMLDANQFAASILNLALNARDAMPSGGRLRIAATNMAITPASPWSELAVGDYVCITVSDSGTGMPPSVVSRAFEPYFTTKAPDTGAGLGLSQVHGMVRQSGGSITIESRVGEGTEVRILLPRGLVALPLPFDGVDLAQPAIERRRSLLLVDDDEQVRAVTEAMLVESGYTVLTATEGAKAIEILERAASPVALVIADYSMPGVSGSELLREVKRRWPDIAVLLATGYADYAELTSRELPIDHIIRKPFRNVELLARIHLVMQRQANPERLENGVGVE
jgi:signal transduction histidine kinase/CheY-like chemotaxis protein